MEHILYWLWLTGLFGVESGNFIPIIEEIGGIENFFSQNNYSSLGIKSPKVIEKLNNKNLEWAKKVYRACEKKDIEMVPFDSEDYPSVLRHIFTPPALLYMKGQIPDWDELFMIGVVGTRYATEYGIKVTGEICTSLSEAGVTLVSGFARGIDAAATKSAVNLGEYSVSVCASGLDVDYPKQNKKLKEAVLKNGVLISEYPPGFQAFKWAFRPRNRIIAGLSNGVLVTEAPKKSGALITAYRALEENRDIFVVPGKIDDANFEGVNGLIRNGAKVIFSADDILAEYPHYKYKLKPHRGDKPSEPFVEKPRNEKKREQTKKEVKTDKKSELVKKEFRPINKTGTEGEILKLLTEKNMHIDEMIREIGVSPTSFNTAILMLEICGEVKRLPGNVFQRLK